jgi:glutaminase
VTQLYSRRLRSEADRAALEHMRHRARTYVLQGDLSFAAVEAFAHRVVEASAVADFVLVDLKRVTDIEACAVVVVARLLAELGALGKQMVFIANKEHGGFLRALQIELASSEHGGELKSFSDRDPALEWCENRLLSTVVPHGIRSVTLAEHEMCTGFDRKALATLEQMLEPRRYAQGAMIVRQGDRADEVFLLMSGNVSVTIELPGGELRRLSTVSPGMTFGELTVIDRSPRTADVHADTPVECLVLPAAAFDRMTTDASGAQDGDPREPAAERAQGRRPARPPGDGAQHVGVRRRRPCASARWPRRRGRASAAPRPCARRVRPAASGSTPACPRGGSAGRRSA